MGVFRYVVCDVFTDRPLTGNQLAVFTDARGIAEDDLQPLAREMALSETVFVYPANGDAHVRLRIFTPESELPFAGHPVLGSAFVLGGPLQAETVRLETGVGVIPVQLEREGARIVFGRMTQPVPTWKPFAHTDELLAALGVERSELPVEVYDNGLKYVYVVLRSADDVAAPPARSRPSRRAPRSSRHELSRRLGKNAGRRGCSRPPTASRRILRPDLRRGRSPCTSPPRARRLRRRDRDLPGGRAQAPVDALRDRVGDSRARSSASRSPAAQSSSRGGSSSCDPAARRRGRRPRRARADDVAAAVHAHGVDHARVDVEKAGTGTGTVVSSPPGIDCGETCSFSFLTGNNTDDPELFTLTGVPDPGSELEGFEGCCPIRLMPGETYSVTAVFTRLRPTAFQLAVTVIGSGTVTSQPGGILPAAGCARRPSRRTARSRWERRRPPAGRSPAGRAAARVPGRARSP